MDLFNRGKSKAKKKSGDLPIVHTTLQQPGIGATPSPPQQTYNTNGAPISPKSPTSHPVDEYFTNTSGKVEVKQTYPIIFHFINPVQEQQVVR